MIKIPVPKIWSKIFILIIVFAIGLAVGSRFLIKNQTPFNQSQNTYRAFISEVYDKIKENYWNNISDAELLDLFRLSLAQSGISITTAKFDGKDKLLEAADKATSTQLVSAVSSVLSTLTPVGRSGLFTTKQEEALKNTVGNINPEKDLYKDLGLSKGASEAAVEEAYKKQAVGANPEKLKQLTYAKDTLSQKDQKENYDKGGIEPTIFTKVLNKDILYVQFRKFSPTSLEEFQKAFENYKDKKLDALILDLRGNVGGAIDATAYFLGFFLGKGQYAFDFYHKGEYLPFKTPTDKLTSLTKYKQIIILVDQNTQSSAEMLAASLKKYNIGVVLGVPTKGWGTVERVFPLDNQLTNTEKYSIFLVHSITLRDDNQPIEGRGVEPDINITDSSWPQKLLEYFNNQTLVDSVKQILQ